MSDIRKPFLITLLRIPSSPKHLKSQKLELFKSELFPDHVYHKYRIRVNGKWLNNRMEGGDKYWTLTQYQALVLHNLKVIIKKYGDVE